MTRIVGRDHRALAGTGDECPSVTRLAVVVMAAKRIEVVERRRAALRPVVAVVDLDAGARAPLDRARR
jgi:acetolactate synthase small subunit